MPWQIEWTFQNNPGIKVDRTTDLNGNHPSVQQFLAAAAAAPNDLISLVASRRPADPADSLAIDFNALLSGVKDRKYVPFLGAGASYIARGKRSGPWQMGDWFPPSAGELAWDLANWFPYRGTSPYEWRDLARIASRYIDVHSLEQLKERLHAIFSPAAQPPREQMEGTPQWFFARCKTPMLIVTTNYDKLLENEFLYAKQNDGGLDFDIVVQPSPRDEPGDVVYFQPGDPESLDTERAELLEELEGIPDPSIRASLRPYYKIKTGEDLQKLIDFRQRTVIYKMHGSVGTTPEQGTYVINEEDYVGALERGGDSMIPPILKLFCGSRNFLFLGYSLRDWNFRVILDVLQRGSTNGRKHQAIQYEVTTAESAFWGMRKVTVYDWDLADVFRILSCQAGYLPAFHRHGM